MMLVFRSILANALFLFGATMCAVAAYTIHIAFGHAVVGVSSIAIGLVSAAIPASRSRKGGPQ